MVNAFELCWASFKMEETRSIVCKEDAQGIQWTNASNTLITPSAARERKQWTTHSSFLQMLQSVCKEGNDISHSHRTTKVCAWLLVPTTYLEPFPSAPARARRRGPQSPRSGSHLPALRWSSQNPPTHPSPAVPLLPVRVGRHVRGL